MLTYTNFIEVVEKLGKDSIYWIIPVQYRFYENDFICLHDGVNLSIIGLN